MLCILTVKVLLHAFKCERHLKKNAQEVAAKTTVKGKKSWAFHSIQRMEKKQKKRGEGKKKDKTAKEEHSFSKPYNLNFFSFFPLYYCYYCDYAAEKEIIIPGVNLSSQQPY